MTTVIKINIEPRPKQSTRFSKNGYAYRSKEVKEYDEILYWSIREQTKDKYAGAVTVSLVFAFTPPKKLNKNNCLVVGDTKYKLTKPDVDNLSKPVLDALEKTGVLLNDSRVFELNTKKIYTENNKPYVKVVVGDFSGIIKKEVAVQSPERCYKCDKPYDYNDYEHGMCHMCKSIVLED